MPPSPTRRNELRRRIASCLRTFVVPDPPGRCAALDRGTGTSLITGGAGGNGLIGSGAPDVAAARLGYKIKAGSEGMIAWPR